MIKNDYLTAKMDELSQVITEVLKLTENSKLTEGHDVINQALKRLLGLSPNIVEAMPYKELVNFIGAYEAADSIKFMILAELLKLDGDVYKKEKDLNKSFSLYQKALNIYVRSLLLDSETCLERCRKNIDDVVDHLSDYELPFESEYSMFRYFEIIGRYDKSEDILHDRLDCSSSDINMLEEGISFYTRLLNKSEAELVGGNLPKDEVKEGLQSLKKLYTEK